MVLYLGQAEGIERYFQCGPARKFGTNLSEESTLKSFPEDPKDSHMETSETNPYASSTYLAFRGTQVSDTP